MMQNSMNRLVNLIASLIIIAGCTAGPNTVVVERPDPCPKWVNRTPVSTDSTLFFVGLSGEGHSSEKDARRSAVFDSINQFAAYCGVQTKYAAFYYSQYEGKSSAGIDPWVDLKERYELAANHFISRVKDDEWCIQIYQHYTPAGLIERSYKAYALTRVPLDEVKSVKDERQKILKQIFSNRFTLDYIAHTNGFTLYWNHTGYPWGGFHLFKHNGYNWVSDPKDVSQNSVKSLTIDSLGFRYKVGIRNRKGAWIYSNEITLENECKSRRPATFNVITTVDELSPIINRFKDELITRLETAALANGKYEGSVDRRCSDRLMRLQIYQEDKPRQGGYTLNIKNIGDESIVMNGKYTYHYNDEKIALIDKVLVDRAAQKLIKRFASLQMIEH